MVIGHIGGFFAGSHEVYKGSTFERHTILEAVKKFQEHHHLTTKPIIVADAAMLSQKNIKLLEAQGY